jgi:hypothetical protein
MTTDLSGDSRPERGSGSWFTAMTRAWRANPSLRLLVGLFVTLATISGFTLYTIREVRNLRDEQTAISERNRLDSLQLLRIQNNLSEIALSMRDMADGAEPYERIYWRQTFDRRRTDLDQAIEAERALAPAERPAAQQERLHSAVDPVLGDDGRGLRRDGRRPRRGGGHAPAHDGRHRSTRSSSASSRSCSS